MIYNENYTHPKYKNWYYFLKHVPPPFYPLVLKHLYKEKFHVPLNLLEPQRLSEKILKSCLDDKDIKKTKLTDKLKAKEYVKNVIPDLKYAKVYQIADSFNELDFSFAPNSFVIKTNHAWKTHILVQDKRLLKSTDYNEFKQYYKSVLSINYAYWGSYELQYKNITPKIFLEEYLCFENEGFIKEYEVYCFKGKPMFINYLISPNYTPDLFNCQSDIVKSQIFDTNWEQANFKIRFSSGLSTPDTKNKELILTYAEKLSYGFDFVRIDIFEIGDELYFGEFTFSPYSGFITFIPEKFDLIYGQKY